MNIFDYLRFHLNDNGFIQFMLMDLSLCKRKCMVNHLGGIVWGVEIKKEYAIKLTNALFDFYYARIKEFKKELKFNGV